MSIRHFRVAAAVVAVAGLTAGCATTDLAQTKTREINSEHVSGVERAASRTGVRIVWINPPTRVRERTLEFSVETTVER